MSFNDSRIKEKLKNHHPHPDGNGCGWCKNFTALIYMSNWGVTTGKCKVQSTNKYDFDYCSTSFERIGQPRENIYKPDKCHNCEGCRNLDFYYCANCGQKLRNNGKP